MVVQELGKLLTQHRARSDDRAPPRIRIVAPELAAEARPTNATTAAPMTRENRSFCSAAAASDESKAFVLAARSMAPSRPVIGVGPSSVALPTSLETFTLFSQGK